ncbi:hypothetical protein [Halobellus salinisoli]|uniref:hypothetical protein n=1 Tax=Halobellus salinisoli TaxID=3108500 RepID=UPI003008F0A0
MNSTENGPDMKKVRRENPSSWLELTDNQTLPLIIDSLLDSPPGREFNKQELGRHAGVSRESVRKYIETLLKFGIIKEVPQTKPQRYTLNDKGKATIELFELKSALNAAATSENKDFEQEATEDTGMELDFPADEPPTINI